MNFIIATANQWGAAFLPAGGTMLWQSSLLALVIFALDFGLSRRVRASVRHALWLILLVKLILPTSLALPTSPAWWWSRRAPEAAQFFPPVALPSDPAIFDDNPANTRFPPSISPSAPEPLPTLTPAALTFAMAVAGSIGLLAWLLWRYTLVLRLCRLAAAAPALESLVAEARELACLDASVRIKILSGTTSPAVCGLFRPVILFPQSLVEILSPDQMRAVVLHELIHLRRGDIWINCLQGLLQTVYWWHPLVWLANARMRRVREEAVDDAVMVALRADADIYAPTLIAVARFALRCPRGSLGLVGILESRSALRQRIERLVNSPMPTRAGLTLASVSGLVLFSVAAVPMSAPPPPPPPSGPYETVSSEASLLVNRMNLPRSGVLELPTTDGSKVPWPDPHFNGYQSVNLRVDFFILDESALRAKIPALANGHAPVAFGADEADELFTHLRQAGARFFNNYAEGIDVPGISGTRQHYHIGGFPHQTGTAEFTTTNIDGHSMISGTEIFLSASQSDWAPLDFTVQPWQADDHTRCELKLGTGESPSHFQSAELTIPSGDALVWATTDAVKPGKCEVIFLMSWNTNNGLSHATFEHHRFPPAPGFESFVGVLMQRNWRTPPQSIWPNANDWGREREDLIYPLLHEAGLNWLPPRQLTFDFDSLEVYAPPKDVEVIQSLVGKINKSTLDDEEKELKQVLVANPTNAWARRCLEMIQKSRGTGSSASGQHRTGSVTAGQKMVNPADPATNLYVSTSKVNTNLFKKTLAVMDGSASADWLPSFSSAAGDLEPPAASVDTNLYLRTFKVNPSVIKKSLASLGPLPHQDFVTKANSADDVNAQTRTLFKAMGVSLKSPETAFWNGRLNLLFVKGTVADLVAVERIVTCLNQLQDGPLDDRPFDTIRPMRAY